MTKNEGRAPTKVYFATDELQVVKLAAVVRGLTASEFARQATLAAATEEMKNFAPPRLATEPTTARKKKHA
jgi:hypothetical protein